MRSVTLREERRLRLFENRVLRRIFGTGRNCIMRCFMICTLSKYDSSDKI